MTSEQRGASCMDVRAHNGGSPGAVTRRERVDEFSVVLETAGERIRRVPVEGPVDDRHLHDLLEQCDDPVAPGGLHDRGVELTVELRDPPPGALPTTVLLFLHAVSQLAQPVQGGGVDGLGREPMGVGLDEGPEIEDLPKVGFGVGHHLCAPVGAEFHQAVGVQATQRLADRGAADPDDIGELLFTQPVALGVIPGEDARPDGFVSGVGCVGHLVLPPAVRLESIGLGVYGDWHLVRKLSRNCRIMGSGVYTSMIDIIEVAPRDGLQNEPTLLDTATKVALIERAIAAGARRIEATSFVNPRAVPAMADADAVMAAVPRSEEVSYIGLVLNQRGLDRALAAGVNEINAVVVASDTFNQRNQGVSTAASLDAWADMARAAHDAGIRASLTIAAAFGCPFEGEVHPDHVLGIAEAALASGPDELALADTIGVGVPAQVRRLVNGLRALDGGVPLRLHLHNTRNTGYANALAGVEAGVAALDASLGGIGGCPFAPNATGNIATEDLVYVLERSGVPTGLDPDRLAAGAVWLGNQLGKTVPGQLSRAGGFPSSTA